ncbi:MAG: ATP-binding protein [Gemmatimonadetes bacterium]|nr:ATP-binding protein [Gemmatimonadota bacterium]MYG21524.1 ATP-binding protein [Gemmatimonadota bacterium]MYJ38132.1 ATP-binding protein [Gemmatimonadota bacterium]
MEAGLQSLLATFPVVVVIGARQTGKTTLVREIGGDGRKYLTLDDYDVLDQALRAPDQLLVRGRRITLDEVQRAPDLLLAVKRVVDASREPGRFLLTGSANLSLMKGVSETLAGRAAYVTLWPMTRREAVGAGATGSWDVFVDLPAADWPSALEDGLPCDRLPWMGLARRGGYPIPALSLRSDANRAAWFEGYLRTYLERDLQQLAAIDNLVGFQRLIRATALRVGGLLNQADLARDAGLPPTTALRYVHLLNTSYQLVRVEPYAVNRTKRMVKSPRIYWSDTGLALHLAGGEPKGAHFENLLVNDLFAWRETRTPRPEVLFWRTSKGAEVDLVIETPGRLIPVEVKGRPRLRVSDARHLKTFMRDYRDEAPAGVVIYAGRETYWLTDGVLAVPWDRVA